MKEGDRPRDRQLHRLEPAEREVVCETIGRALASDDPPLFAYVFGSFAEGDAFHDIDVGLHFGGLPSAAASRRAEAAAARLASLVPFPLDVVALDAQPAPFRFHVYRGRLVLARDEDFLAAELERTMRTYFDIEPLLRRAAVEAFSE